MSASTRLMLAAALASWYLPPWLQRQYDRGTASKVKASATENWPDALEDPDRRIAHPSAPAMDILESLDMCESAA